MAKSGVLLGVAGGAAAGILLCQPAAAEEELRVGVMLELPFGGSKHQSFVHFDSTRIGAKVQYAEVEEIEKRIEHVVDRVFQDGVLVSSEEKGNRVVTVSEGDQVYGGEFYLMVAPFTGKWTISTGINAFGGNNDFQGAAGFGYDPTFGGYMEIAALMPFSEAGVRLNLSYIDYFIGATSFSGFSPEKVWQKETFRFNDTSNTTVYYVEETYEP
jgi:hypothetical protein